MDNPTLKEVAEHCGVSQITVSRVIRGVLKVKPETRDRVEASIAALSYRPNPIFRALSNFRLRKSKFHGILAYMDCDSDHWSHSMHKIAVKEAEALGYALKYFELPDEKDAQQKLSRTLWHQGISGLLFGPSRVERDIGGIKAEYFSMVSIGNFHHVPAIDAVGIDYFQGLYLAATQCHNLGARRIALMIPENLEARTGHRWEGSYLAFCQEYGLAPRLWRDQKRWSQCELMLKWIRREKVDAVLGLPDIEWLPERVPGLIFASLNDWQLHSATGHIHLPHEVIVGEAIKLINDNLLHQRYGIPSWPKYIALEGKWRKSQASQSQKNPPHGEP